MGRGLRQGGRGGRPSLAAGAYGPRTREEVVRPGAILRGRIRTRADPAWSSVPGPPSAPASAVRSSVASRPPPRPERAGPPRRPQRRLLGRPPVSPPPRPSAPSSSRRRSAPRNAPPTTHASGPRSAGGPGRTTLRDPRDHSRSSPRTSTTTWSATSDGSGSPRGSSCSCCSSSGSPSRSGTSSRSDAHLVPPPRRGHGHRPNVVTRAAGLAATIVRPSLRALRRARPLLDCIFPSGALLLATLTLATYAMGLLRNKVFASTYGLGTELDAYLYAFFLPEIVFDVIAASGLTAPFVPILTRLRRDDAAAAQRFAQTVVTSIVLVMTVVAVVMALLAPWIADIAAASFDPATKALYADLLRVAALIQVLFATSLGLAEILVADRRFLAYQLAPILYYAGIIAGTLALHGRL